MSVINLSVTPVVSFIWFLTQMWNCIHSVTLLISTNMNGLSDVYVPLTAILHHADQVLLWTSFINERHQKVLSQLIKSSASVNLIKAVRN